MSSFFSFFLQMASESSSDDLKYIIFSYLALLESRKTLIQTETKLIAVEKRIQEKECLIEQVEIIQEQLDRCLAELTAEVMAELQS